MAPSYHLATFTQVCGSTHSTRILLYSLLQSLFEAQHAFNLCLKRSTLSFFFSPTCARTSWCETLWVRRHPLLVGHFSHSGTPEAKHRCGFNRSWCLNPLFSRTEDSQFSPSMFSWVLCSPAVSCVTQHKHH